MTTDRITLPELEQYLAKAADLLRGSIDQADFKAYIFPLMFFKRISDVYTEEFAEALAESGGDHEFAAFAENHRFAIPKGSLWAEVRNHTENIGSALQTAFREIEKANPETLYGILGTASWTNKDKLPDRKLAELIEHFSTKTLSNAAVAPDVFGNAYEYLIKRFADLSNKKAGEYYTPRSVVSLLINILNPVEGESVYDPACGTGGMLIEVIEHVKTAGGSPKTLWGKLYGQEKVLATSAIARMNLLLHGVEDFKIVREDTLRNPAFYTGNHLAQFDCVVANPPFSLKNWGETAWASDKWGRNGLGGVPPKGYADWAWVQHMLTSASPAANGRVAVVLPQGALFRQGAEARIRSHILKSNVVDAVIGLAPNLFYGTGLAACVLILRLEKPSDRKDKVLFINGERLYKRGRNQNTLEPEHARQMLDAFELDRHAEASLRAALVSSDLIECVLGLGAGLFYNSPMEAVVVTLRANKPAERKGKVLFINAVSQVAREHAQSFLRERHQMKILDAYRSFANIDHFSAVAALDQIGENGYSLAIPLYVATKASGDEQIGVVDALMDWRTSAIASETASVVLLGRLRSEVSE